MQLNAKDCRTIAEAYWGTGGTTPYRTNRNGVYYYSCSGHGGFVLDANALTDDERAAIAPFINPYKYTAYVWTVWGQNGVPSEKYRVMFPERKRRFRVPLEHYKYEGHFYIFEEDCDWALLYKLTTIRRLGDHPDAEEAAEKTFYNWHDPANPRVAERNRRWKMREEGHPDYIVSASLMDDRTMTRVLTADGIEHTVMTDSYDPQNPFLSACIRASAGGTHALS